MDIESAHPRRWQHAAAETLIAMHLVHDQALASPLREGLQSLTSLVADRKAGHYTKFIDGEFLRATAKDRAEYNKVALGGAGAPGRATINESATGTTMDEYDGGDHIYAPINAGPIGRMACQS